MWARLSTGHLSSAANLLYFSVFVRKVSPSSAGRNLSKMIMHALLSACDFAVCSWLVVVCLFVVCLFVCLFVCFCLAR